jgi:hypothetical protein
MHTNQFYGRTIEKKYQFKNESFIRFKPETYQEVYIIRNKSQSKPKKTGEGQYYKIPVISENVKIMEYNTLKKNRKESVKTKEVDCSNCRYCMMVK